jgi:hypothetical protein
MVLDYYATHFAPQSISCQVTNARFAIHWSNGGGMRAGRRNNYVVIPILIYDSIEILDINPFNNRTHLRKVFNTVRGLLMGVQCRLIAILLMHNVCARLRSRFEQRVKKTARLVRPHFCSQLTRALARLALGWPCRHTGSREPSSRRPGSRCSRWARLGPTPLGRSTGRANAHNQARNRQASGVSPTRPDSPRRSPFIS